MSLENQLQKDEPTIKKFQCKKIAATHRHSSSSEQVVTQAIQKDANILMHRLLFDERDDSSFCSPAYGACHVQKRRCLAAYKYASQTSPECVLSLG
jgi:hypothetical protein